VSRLRKGHVSFTEDVWTALEKLRQDWHQDSQVGVLELLVRREVGLPPFDRPRQGAPSREQGLILTPTPAAPPIPLDLLNIKTDSEEYALQQPPAPASPAPPRPDPPPPPPVAPPAPIAPPASPLPPEPIVRDFEDADAPVWVIAVASALSDGEEVADDVIGSFQRWRRGYDEKAPNGWG
jgi:hypothetical protein